MLKACLLLLALMGIVVKGLIPVGFMPEFSKHAGTAIVICSGVEQKTIYVDEDGKPAKSGHEAKVPCDFAYTPTLTTPVHQSQIALVVLSVSAKLIPHEVTYTSASSTPPPITGPPTIV